MRRYRHPTVQYCVPLCCGARPPWDAGLQRRRGNADYKAETRGNAKWDSTLYQSVLVWGGGKVIGLNAEARAIPSGEQLSASSAASAAGESSCLACCVQQCLGRRRQLKRRGVGARSNDALQLLSEGLWVAWAMWWLPNYRGRVQAPVRIELYCKCGKQQPSSFTTPDMH